MNVRNIPSPSQTTSRWRELLFSLVYTGAAFFVFIYVVNPHSTAWIIDHFKPLFSFGKALEVFASHLSSLIYLGCAVLFYRMLQGSVLLNGFTGGNIHQLAKCCFGVVLLFGLFQAWLFVSNHPSSQWEIDYVLGAGQGPIVVFNTALLVPINEELVFRGVLPFTLMNLFLLLPMLFRKEPSPTGRDCAYMIAMVFSCLAFAVLHHRGFVYDLYFLVLGLWFGYWAYKTSGLIIPMIGHSLAGSLAVGTIYLQYA